MKIKSIMAMIIMATTVMFGVCACGSDDDDEPEVALASQVAGSYSGEEIMTVMGEATPSTTIYEFAKSSDIAVDMTIPAMGDEGGMSLPALKVKNIMLAKNDNSVVGKLASYSGTVINEQGAEKAYTVSDLIVIFNGKAVVVTYSLKYGNMPFAFIGKFTGTKK